MEKEQKTPSDQEGVEEEDTEALELVLFQVSECYVYLVSFLGISYLGFIRLDWINDDRFLNYNCMCILFL